MHDDWSCVSLRGSNCQVGQALKALDVDGLIQDPCRQTNKGQVTLGIHPEESTSGPGVTKGARGCQSPELMMADCLASQRKSQPDVGRIGLPAPRNGKLFVQLIGSVASPIDG